MYQLYIYLYFSLWGLGDQNSANVCPCACLEKRLIMGYKLSYTTSLLYAGMQWGVWVWTVGHWVVLVLLMYCSKGGWVLFLKEPTASLTGNPGLHSRKPDLPVTYSSPFSTWLIILFFFSSPVKTKLSGQGYWVCWWWHHHCQRICLTRIIFCVLYRKQQIV